VRDVRRALGFLPFTAAVQTGGLFREKVRDVRRQSINWTYVGPDGNATTPDSPAPFGMKNYVNQPEFYGLSNLPWVSLYRAWDGFTANPTHWTKTPAQVVAEEQFRINNSERLQESVAAHLCAVGTGIFSQPRAPHDRSALREDHRAG